MSEEKSTEDLTAALESTHSRDIARFLAENRDSMQKPEKAFSDYMKEILKEKGLLQQEVFLQADIPERYGYKLLSEEKRTKQRDVILRLCYAARFSLAQTQKALRIYGMPELYVKIPRDALLMVCFNEQKGSVIEVNSFLRANGMDALRSSGVQD